MQQVKKKDPTFKVLLIGDSGVGKTSLIMAALGMQFNVNIPSTIEAASQFKPKKMRVNERDIVLKLQDTAGQEKYRSIANSYYKGSHGAFLAFDLTDDNSFKNIKHWMRQLKTLAGNVQRVLLGNKADMEGRKVSQLDIDNFCSEQGVKYFEVSAKTRQNVNEAVQLMAQQLVSTIPEEQPPVQQDKLQLSSAKIKQAPPKKSCCS